MNKTVILAIVVAVAAGFLSGCDGKRPAQSPAFASPDAQIPWLPANRHLVLESLDRPAFREAMPWAKEISLQEFMTLKATHIERHGSWSPKYAVTYRQREGDDWRSFWLALESFDDDSVWVAELTQYKSGVWDWIARYRVPRSPEVDEEFGIHRILAKRSKVLGGVRYGMTAQHVVAVKGGHFKINRHAEGGSADLVYDDVIVSVREWFPPRGRGRVVGVKPTTEGRRHGVKDMPYEDER